MIKKKSIPNLGFSGMTPMTAEEEPAPLSDQGLVVDLTPPPEITKGDNGVIISQYGDGVAVDFNPEIADTADSPLEEGHDDNLAEYINDSVLSQIATDLIEKVNIDKQSRQAWTNRYKEGVHNLGIIDDVDRDAPFDGASSVVYPLLSIGVIQFQARALNELFPATGPVKGVVVGEKTEDKFDQAKRVEDHMNYQILEEDTSFFPELDQMLFYLPIGGSAFKKVYYDALQRTTVSRFVRPEDFIVPYTATNLETAPRYAHQILIECNQMRKHQASGFYLKIDLPYPGQEKGGNKEAIDEVDDKADDRTPTYAENDYRHTVYEIHCDYDIPGFEDKGKDGEPTGIALPYIISIDLESQKVLAIRRNWKKDDDLKRKRVWFVHYKYLPGTGFYGFGLLHIIGGLSKAATGTLRALLDSAAMATLQGGFKSKDSRLAGGDMTLTPGEWKDVNLTSDELHKAFYTPPFKEPSPAMYQLLGLLIDAGKNATSTTEAMVGDASNTGPVGTTLALIEQGSKVYSGIHKRLHMAAKIEFRLRAELNYDHLPDDEAYPYDVVGGNRFIKGSDYDSRVDVIPVSDPNVFSSTQRIAQAQAVLQLSQQDPSLYRKYKVHKQLLDAMAIAMPEDLLIDPDKKERLDPVSENMAMLVGKPVFVFGDQNHDAHIAVHTSFFQHPQFGGLPQAQQMMGGAMLAHIAEHLAYLYKQRMEEAGAATQNINLSVAPGEDMLPSPTDPQTENIISSLDMQVIDKFMQSKGLTLGNDQQQQQQGPSPQDQQAEAGMQQKAMQFQAEQQQKTMEVQAEQQRKDTVMQADQARKDEESKREQQRKEMEMQAEMALKKEKMLLEEQIKREVEISRLQMAAKMQPTTPIAPITNVPI